jgi:hypothetical protein
MTRTSLPAFGLALAATLVVSVGHGEPNARREVPEKQSSTPAASATPGTSSAEVARCVADHESARLQRVREQWLPARDAMTRCSAESCPLSIRTDCRAWLEELSRLLPTVLIVIERDDNRSEPVELELDGQLLKLPEPLGPIELLPGSHRLSARLAAHAPIERDLVLEVGAKNQVVRLRFTTPPVAHAPKTESSSVRRTIAAPTPRMSRPTPAISYWLGGGALVALATSGALLGSALVSLDSARETCAPGCSSSVRDSIDARLLAADVSGGVGLLLAGLALYSYFERPQVLSPSGAAPRLAPRLTGSGKGAEIALSGHF